MSNVILIYPQPDFNKTPRFGFSYNLLILATILKNSGNNITLLDFSCDVFCDSIFQSTIKKIQPDVVIVEFDSFALKRSENYTNGVQIVALTKEVMPSTVVIAYGYHCCITQTPIQLANQTILNNNLSSFIELFRTVLANDDISLLANYDDTPYIDRGLLNQIDFYKKNCTSTLIQTSIGCENTCIFCQRKGWHSKFQTHSYEYILNEFKLLQQQGFINVWITDENFTFKLPRAKKILLHLIESKSTEKMNLFISSWANIDTEFLELAAKANVKSISFGIESANDEILQFYRKNIVLKKVKRVIQYANSLGIFTIGNFIVGAPMETNNTISNTFTFIKDCEFDQINIKTLDYMIGSQLYDEIPLKEKGRSHLFACLENGLNSFPLQELTNIKGAFCKAYYAENKERIKRKMLKYGTPYMPLI